MIKVCKFGGSSLASAGQFKKVLDIVKSDDTRRVIVVSAPGKRNPADNKLTDLLYLSEAHVRYGVDYSTVFGMVEQRFRDIAEGCGITGLDLDAEFSEIRSHMVKGVSPDYLASRGEYLCAKLMAAYLGFQFVDAAGWMLFGNDGRRKQRETESMLSAALQEYGYLVLPGFYGSLPGGEIRTMPRGGSDISGAVAAAALHASVYENWTDVSGILMADPRIVEDPRPIPQLTYSELRELSYMGADVLHEDAVFPVKEKDIPLNIRNTNDPNAPGTMIREKVDESEVDGAGAQRFITGISGRRGYTIISVYKSHMSGEVGAIKKVLAVLEGYGINVEHIPSGIDSFSFVVLSDQVKRILYDIISDIKEVYDPDDIRITDNIALIAAVGRKMMYRPGISGRLFGALGENGINIRMIAQGPAEINIIVGVENKDFDKSIRVLYNSFMG